LQTITVQATNLNNGDDGSLGNLILDIVHGELNGSFSSESFDLEPEMFFVEFWNREMVPDEEQLVRGDQGRCYKTFYSRNLRISQKARVFIPGKPQLSLMFVRKAKNLP
jgi:hypothetical protein